MLSSSTARTPLLFPTSSSAVEAPVGLEHRCGALHTSPRAYRRTKLQLVGVPCAAVILNRARSIYDVLTLAHFHETLLVETKQAVNKNASRWEKISKYRILRTAAPVREGNVTINNELWYTIPCHLQPTNTRNISMVFHVHPKQNKKAKCLCSGGQDRVPTGSGVHAVGTRGGLRVPFPERPRKRRQGEPGADAGADDLEPPGPCASSNIWITSGTR